MIASRVVLVVVLAAAQAVAAAAARRAPAPSRGAVQTSDREIEKAIRERFARSKIGANHFEVRVQGGVATLTGNTDVIQHKGTATRLAKSSGALTVVNRIQISEAAREKAAANLAKGRRRAQIKRGESSPRSEPR